MKSLAKILVIFAVIISLAVPAQAADGIDIGKDWGKLPTKYMPAIALECVVLKGWYVTVDMETMAISMKKADKCNENENQCFMIWPVKGKPGYYTICVDTDYGNHLYLNHPGKGKYPNVIYSKFKDGDHILPNTALWKFKWMTIQTGGRSVTGWSLVNAETKWVFATTGWASWKIRVLNG